MNVEEKFLSILKKDPRLANREVHCQAETGGVILRGWVRSFFEKQLAQEILRRIEGVGEIHNELEVRPEAQKSFIWNSPWEVESTSPDLVGIWPPIMKSLLGNV